MSDIIEGKIVPVVKLYQTDNNYAPTYKQCAPSMVIHLTLYLVVLVFEKVWL